MIQASRRRLNGVCHEDGQLTPASILCVYRRVVACMTLAWRAHFAANACADIFNDVPASLETSSLGIMAAKHVTLMRPCVPLGR